MGEEKNFVTAFQIHKGKVFTSDQKKIGIIVNLIIDPEMDFAARLLIFPEEKPWWIDWLSQRGQEMSLDLIKQVLPEETDKILKDVAEKGPDVALQLWKEHLKRRKCYLVSLLEISKIDGQTVHLKSSLNQIETGYGDIATNENEIAFFDEDALSSDENKTLLSITLELPNFKGKKVSDQQGGKGRIFNIQLDTTRGQVTNIIVQTVGENPGNHIISSKDFDWSTFETTTNLAIAPIQK